MHDERVRREQLGAIFVRGAGGLYAGDTLSHQLVRELADARLVERNHADRWIATEGGVAYLWGMT